MFQSFLGRCSDTTSIVIVYTGEVDKPFYELVFHLSGAVTTENKNPFQRFHQVSKSELRKLIQVTIKPIYNDTTAIDPQKDYYCSQYHALLFSSNEKISARRVSGKSDLLNIKSKVISVFTGTDEEAVVKESWKLLLGRLGIL
jgi:hypothetical protein